MGLLASVGQAFSRCGVGARVYGVAMTTPEQPKAQRTPKTPAQVLEHAQQSVDFLIRHCIEFDRGRVYEVKQIAHQLRILLQHTADKPGPGSSHALLRQSKHLDRLNFLDTGGDFEQGDLLRSTLAALTVTPAGAADWIPRFSAHQRASYSIGEVFAAQQRGESLPRAPGKLLPFEQWWESTVLRDDVGNSFTRRRLVLAVANEEGGSHVDPETRADVQALAHDNSMGWSSPIDGPNGRKEISARSPMPAVVRQIAWEVQSTIYAQADELLIDEHRGTPPLAEPMSDGSPGFIITRLVASAEPPLGGTPYRPNR